jgi:hypothetical protein
MQLLFIHLLLFYEFVFLALFPAINLNLQLSAVVC